MAAMKDDAETRRLRNERSMLLRDEKLEENEDEGAQKRTGSLALGTENSLKDRLVVKSFTSVG